MPPALGLPVRRRWPRAPVVLGYERNASHSPPFHHRDSSCPGITFSWLALLCQAHPISANRTPLCQGAPAASYGVSAASPHVIGRETGVDRILHESTSRAPLLVHWQDRPQQLASGGAAADSHSFSGYGFDRTRDAMPVPAESGWFAFDCVRACHMPLLAQIWRVRFVASRLIQLFCQSLRTIISFPIAAAKYSVERMMRRVRPFAFGSKEKR